jgi:hypothetical protein
MVKVVESTVVDAPIERVWAVVRDFNGQHRWHPPIAESRLADGGSADEVGCVRRLRLAGGEELTEKLLGLSDLETSYTYCLLETPIPLFNYVAEVRLVPVTDGDRTFWRWQASFTTRRGDTDAMTTLVRDGIMRSGFSAMRHHLGLEAS